RLFPEGLRVRQRLRELEGIVDEEVEAALFPLHLLEQRRDLIVLAVIHPNGDALAAAPVDFGGGLADRTGQRVRARNQRAPGDVDGCALVREAERDPLSDAAAGARDDGDLARK